uniref:Uncharacterized protein n=1 Tax=Arundo donax TaxID=35708 RepID=A0A0A9H0H3_ARUDO
MQHYPVKKHTIERKLSKKKQQRKKMLTLVIPQDSFTF